MSRIEQLIDEIEEFIEGCKPQPFSQSKVVVPKDELYELLSELRLRTPEEIKRYQKIIANRDKIISDAQAQAERMVEETTVYTNQLVEEHQIMLKAYERAEEVMNNANAQAEATISAANADADQIRRSALQYTNDMIANVEQIIGRTLEGARTNSQALIDGLSYNYNILSENREALNVQIREMDGTAAAQAQPAPEPAPEPETDYSEAELYGEADSYEIPAYEPEAAEPAPEPLYVNVPEPVYTPAPQPEPSYQEETPEPEPEAEPEADEDDEFDYDDID